MLVNPLASILLSSFARSSWSTLAPRATIAYQYGVGGDLAFLAKTHSTKLLRRHLPLTISQNISSANCDSVANVWPGASAPSNLYLQCLGLSDGLLELSLSAEPRVTNAWTDLLLFRDLRCRLPFGYPLDRFVLTACRLFFYIKPFGFCQLAAFRLPVDFSFIQTALACVKRLTSSLFRFALNHCARLD